ncbi:restriction endonuclease [Bergeyella porcorum]|uniref:Restriction endonuclease n=1 Tax=Bergeyella porcorum TaxID=1735111 RepID=A0AAU0F314_9FLAO
MEVTSIKQIDLNRTYSYADYLLWKLKERVELLRGKVLKMSPAPSTKHQLVSGNLYGGLFPLFKNQQCKLFSAPFDVRLPSKSNDDEDIFTVVQPDICIICDPNKIDEKGCIGAPDLIIEILSPGNSKKEMKDKFQLYEEVGVKEYWIVDPNQESVIINVLEEGSYDIKKIVIDDMVSSYIFSNLSIHTNDIFNV